VGVDDYAYVRPHKGAVADARDLEQALRQAGVADLAVLIDAAATRTAVIAAMERLVREAQPNDLVIVTFAGHGTQRDEVVKNSKPDHKDEAFVLRNFDPKSTAGTPDLVIGPEIKHWLGRLEEKGADVLFLADTCHCGRPTRS